MGIILTVITGLSLLGGGALLLSGTKKPKKPIILPDEFYKKLHYFKLEYKNIVAVKNEGSLNELIYEGNSVAAAESYLIQLQLGFEHWLEMNDISQTKNDTSKVNFS